MGIIPVDANVLSLSQRQRDDPCYSSFVLVLSFLFWSLSFTTRWMVGMFHDAYMLSPMYQTDMLPFVLRTFVDYLTTPLVNSVQHRNVLDRTIRR